MSVRRDRVTLDSGRVILYDPLYHDNVVSICKWTMSNFAPCCLHPELSAHLPGKIWQMTWNATFVSKRFPLRCRSCWRSWSWKSVSSPVCPISLAHAAGYETPMTEVSCVMGGRDGRDSRVHNVQAITPSDDLRQLFDCKVDRIKKYA